MADNKFDIVSLPLFHMPCGLCSSQRRWEVKRQRLEKLTMWNGPVKAGREGEDPVVKNVLVQPVGVTTPLPKLLYLVVTETCCCCR